MKKSFTFSKGAEERRSSLKGGVKHSFEWGPKKHVRHSFECKVQNILNGSRFAGALLVGTADLPRMNEISLSTMEEFTVDPNPIL